MYVFSVCFTMQTYTFFFLQQNISEKNGYLCANITSIMQQDWQLLTEERVKKGIALFKEGYNCSQSVALTFADWYGVPTELMAKISAPYGGGIGRMRETCGAALGMFMLAGLETSCPEANQEVKKQTYQAVQLLAARFREQTGSIICKELLGLNKKRADGTIPELSICATPEARTDEYYRKRPCIRMVETAIRTYMQWLGEQGSSPCKSEDRG